MADAGSFTPNTAETTATPAAPDVTVDAALSALIPPIATTGILTAEQIADRVARLMTVQSFVDVGNTAAEQYHISISAR